MSKDRLQVGKWRELLAPAHRDYRYLKLLKRECAPAIPHYASACWQFWTVCAGGGFCMHGPEWLRTRTRAVNPKTVKRLETELMLNLL